MPLFGFPFVITLLAVVLTLTTVASAAPLSVTIEKPPATGRALETLEFKVNVSGGASPHANPYDADQIAVDATLTGPQGESLQIPAFWQVPYENSAPANQPTALTPTAGVAGWRVRIRATVAGDWALRVRARDASGTAMSAPVPIRVSAASPARHGFIERARGAGRARYFQWSDGTPYFAVGENVGWSWNDGIADYRQWFGDLKGAEANFARLWMAFNPLETKATGLKAYDQKNAAYFDEVLRMAERNDVVCMLAFDTYGAFVDGGYFGEGAWKDNPYNAANGGPIATDKPDDFFVNAAARAAFSNRMRYLVARYGAFGSVGFWEVMNEKEAPLAWFAEMSTTLKALDPYKRPITTSYSSTGPAQVWNLENIDLSQTHVYGDEGSMADIAPFVPVDAKSHRVYGKPHLVGEFGITWRGPDTKFDPKNLGTNLHNGLWASALSGNAGSAMAWWWDSYVHPAGLQREFMPLSRFTRAIDWPNRAFEPIAATALTAADVARPAEPLRLQPQAGWGAKSVGPIEIAANGAVGGAGTLLSFLYNVNDEAPDKKAIQGPQEFVVKTPAAGVFRVHIGTVSTRGELRVTVDDKPARNFVFDPSPDGPGGYQETKQFAEYGGIYQARFDAAREIPLRAGLHRIRVENISGDWIGVTAYEFSALQTKRSSLRTLSLQDQASGETLAWIQDPASTWQSDRDGVALTKWNGATVTVPTTKPGAHRIEWWDTRTGQLAVPATQITPRAGQLTLTVPPFTRDIAVRVVTTAGVGN